MPLRQIAEPFDHAEWLFELKYEGFRALAIVENGRCQLLSRNGNRFASFAELPAHSDLTQVAEHPKDADPSVSGHPACCSPCFRDYMETLVDLKQRE